MAAVLRDPEERALKVKAQAVAARSFHCQHLGPQSPKTPLYQQIG